MLRSALTLFARDGYQNTSLTAIGTASGVSHGLVNYYFPSKQELLAELVRQQLAALLDTILTADDTDPDAMLGSLIDTWLRGVAADPDHTALLLSLMVQPGIRSVYRAAEVALADDLVRANQVLVEMFRRRGDADPAISMVMLRSVVEGVLLKAVIYRDSYPLESVRQRLHAMMGLPVPAPIFPDAPGWDGRRLQVVEV